MALADELTALVGRAGRGVLDDANSFAAALDDYLAPEVASRGVLNLLVDAVRQGALGRLLRDIEHGADPARAVAASGDQLARDRAATDPGPSRWAVAVLGYAVGAVDRPVLEAQAAPGTAPAPPAAPPPRPPVASPPLPPTARPPHPRSPAPPVAPQPQWSPGGYPDPSAQPRPRPRRRTGLVLGAVGLAVAVIAGLVVTVVLLADDGPRADRVDDPTVATVTSDGTDSTDGVLTTADPVAIADLLTTVATEHFPGGSAPEVSAQSWSTAPGNLTDGFPRDLAEGERAEATDWLVRTTVGGRALSINVEHEPSDGGTYYEWSCDTFTSSGKTETECDEVATTDGRTAIEYWYRDPEVGIATHAVVIPSDHPTGQPQVLVTERLPDAPKGVTLAELKDTLQLTGEELLRIAEDPRLHLPRPALEPPLPSYGYCVNTHPRPAECPAEIS